jgi:hypothetical protein
LSNREEALDRKNKNWRKNRSSKSSENQFDSWNQTLLHQSCICRCVKDRLVASSLNKNVKKHNRLKQSLPSPPSRAALSSRAFLSRNHRQSRDTQEEAAMALCANGPEEPGLVHVVRGGAGRERGRGSCQPWRRRR